MLRHHEAVHFHRSLRVTIYGCDPQPYFAPSLDLAEPYGIGQPVVFPPIKHLVISGLSAARRIQGGIYDHYHGTCKAVVRAEVPFERAAVCMKKLCPEDIVFLYGNPCDTCLCNPNSNSPLESYEHVRACLLALKSVPELCFRKRPSLVAMAR